MKTNRNVLAFNGTLVLLCSACLIWGPGCGDDFSGNGPPDGSTNNNTNNCYLVLDHDPPSPRVGELVSVDASIYNGTPLYYNWTVTDPNGTPVPFSERNNGRTIEFVPGLSGTYNVNVVVDIPGPMSCSPGDTLVTVAAQDADEETFTLVLTPAEINLAPRQQRNLVVLGRTPQSGLQFQLDPGTPVSIELEGPGGPTDGYVRLTPVGGNLHMEDFYSTQQTPPEFRLFDMATYDVFVVPDTDSVAPAAMTGLTVTEIQNPDTFVLTRGEPVLGSVTDMNAQGLADARVILRCDDVPSAVGVTMNITGAFALYSRPGTCLVTVVPPDGSRWPELVVPDTLGVEVVSGISLSLDFTYRDLTFRTLSGTVVDTDGVTGVPDARVSLISQQLTDLADMVITGDGTPVGPVAVSGAWRGTVLSDTQAGNQGDYQFSSVPAGVYRAVIEPPGGPATVVESIDLTAGDLIGQQLQLTDPVSLHGWVEGEPGTDGAPNEPAADVRVVAVTELGTGSSVETVTDQTGYFELPVVRGAGYTLRFIPGPNAGLSWLVGLQVDVQGSQQVLGPDANNPLLSRGLRLTGQVAGAGSGAGVLMQIFCQGCGHLNPLAETFTDAASSFVLVVPDPGLVDVQP
jgi:hypothetical protein